MAVERLGWRKQVRRWGPAILQILVAAALLALPASTPDAAPSPVVGYVEADHPALAAGRAGAAWRDVSLHEAPTPGAVAWLDWTPTLTAADLDRPMAIAMSGPFSAELFLNGRKVGDKGVPGTDAKTERAGPIDVVIPLPAAQLRPGESRIAIRYSAHRAGYSPSKVVQSLRLTLFTPDPRRDLRYYAPSLLFAGALAGIAAGLTLLVRLREDRRLLGPAAGCAALILALVSEASRALIDYPYDWHQARQLSIGVGVLAFGGLLLAFCISRWPHDPRARRFARNLGLAAPAPCLLLPGYDAKIVVASVALHSLAMGWCVWRGLRGDRTALLFGFVLASFPLVAALSPVVYLDRSIYILAVAALGGPLLLAPDILSPRRSPTTEIQTLSVRTTGRTVFVPIADIVMLKAFGNYTEVHRRQGGWFLDQRGLGAVLEALPASFHRIHRSYAVDLKTVASLISEVGSRYFLELDTGERLPVSRAQVRDVRARLALLGAQATR